MRICAAGVLILALASPLAVAEPPPRRLVEGLQERIGRDGDDACLVLEDLRDAIVADLVIGPCPRYGIILRRSERVTLRNLTIRDTGDIGVYILDTNQVEVEESRLSNTLSGVFAQESEGVQVRCNSMQDMRGPIPRGQFVQFDKVRGAGNGISCNAGRNRAGRSHPEDAISLYKSSGLPASPIRVEHNLIIGGGPSTSGGGIMLGDGGGAHLVAHGNLLIDPGQFGIAVASGEQIAITGNTVLARRQDFTNVGISVWNQYGSPCRDITVRDNRVHWISRSGVPNPVWNAGNCGEVAGLARNDFAASLPADIEDRPEPACTCREAGRRSH